ncbi:diguanylate cyclase [Hydrogenimonas sp. SS33]|uniref:diguanylate cyclase n=1 Tax=Hydrogenimonas leucolamina TaxID=2954236 RepID=UPI00336C2EED
MPTEKDTPFDYSKAVEIAPRIWWVGRVLENDPFQCHVYLIENGEDSVLIDPGSKLTWPETRKKILSLMPLEKIRYIICHHQDPDITSAVGDLLEEIGTEGRRLVTHWRAAELLDHYGWGIDYYEVSSRDWVLHAGKRKLRFIFTPYMHFPGNFCTFDEESRILFSSDIFGAITERFALFADNAESYFRQMKPFHTHYMPAREIVNHGLNNIEKGSTDIEMIAPQHGSIIPREMVKPIMSKLRKLECGLFLEFGGTRNIEMMSEVNDILPRVFETAAYFDNFQADANRIIEIVNRVFPLKRIFALSLIDDDHFIRLDSESAIVRPCTRSKEEIKRNVAEVMEKRRRKFVTSDQVGCLEEQEAYPTYLFPLIGYEGDDVIGVGMFVFDRSMPTGGNVAELVGKFEKAIAIIARREIEVYRMEDEKRRVYKMAITDNLTGLYNRYYLEETGTREMAKSKRYEYPVSVLYMDIDHFKKINDTYGHDVGDLVLKRFAALISENLRESDTAYRLGGEEFLVLMPYTDEKRALESAERLRRIVRERGCVDIGHEHICFTFSAGITDTTEADHDISRLLKIADDKLYRAKESGRDRIVV